MISVADALTQIDRLVRPLAKEELPLSEAFGRVARRDAATDLDSPPFTKAMMDGYAVRSADLVSATANSPVRLNVSGEVAAGATGGETLATGTAAAIMTGAPVPAVADAVVPIELTRTEGATVTFDNPAATGLNVLPRGSIAAAGQTLRLAGRRLTPPRVAALAEFGVARVSVTRTVRAVTISTGDEIVPFNETPGPGQIRNSSAAMLASLMRSWNVELLSHHVCVDSRDALTVAVQDALNADLVLLTGGVSAGRYDFVPDVLGECGVRCGFHKVTVKPGKPLWFGVREDTTTGVVFGLPGNPCSTLVCGELFVRRAVDRMEGLKTQRRQVTLPLAGAVQQKGDRTTYWPCRLLDSGNGIAAEPLPWKGSADLVTMIDCDGWCVLPPGTRQHPAGSVLPFHPASS